MLMALKKHSSKPMWFSFLSMAKPGSIHEGESSSQPRGIAALSF